MNNKPRLLVVAGCNGSGKSTFSRSLVPQGIIPFDYDKCFMEIYRSKSDSELRDRMSHNEAFQTLEQSIANSIKNRVDFCYETNFNSTPIHWPQLFKENGFQIDLVYFCLDSISEAKKRVKIRFENGGHFVPDDQVEERFYLGYNYLNLHFEYFDSVILFDSSGYDAAPTHILSIINGSIDNFSKYPTFLDGLLPKITALVNDFII